MQHCLFYLTRRKIQFISKLINNVTLNELVSRICLWSHDSLYLCDAPWPQRDPTNLLKCNSKCYPSPNLYYCIITDELHAALIATFFFCILHLIYKWTETWFLFALHNKQFHFDRVVVNVVDAEFWGLNSIPHVSMVDLDF